MNNSQHDKARTFHDLHTQEGCFLMPNAWDAGSAVMLEAAGFSAVATTSAGVAFSLGRPDHMLSRLSGPGARLDRDTMLSRIGSMAAAVSVPLNADLEAGYGVSPESVAETIAMTIATGAVGGNIEDYTGEKTAPLFEVNLAVERIRGARHAIDQSGIPFVLTARTDCFLVGHSDAFAESVRRANLFRQAGADCLFIPGVSDEAEVAKLVKEVNGPMNIVMGLTGNSLSFSDLKRLGVRRISIGGSLARAVYHHIRQAAREMFEHGTFTYADQQIPQSELNAIFEAGLARTSPSGQSNE
jgi:2-methylisocitrate lyase-like PEP mutase family enzyme